MPPKRASGSSSAAPAAAVPATSAAASAPATAATLAAAKKQDLELEKKLAPIYEALDANQYKSAFKQLHSAVSKYGRKPMLLTLLAYAHSRAGSHEDAMAIAIPLAQHSPSITQPSILGTLTLIFSAANASHYITPMYESAVAAATASNTLDEQLLLALFHSYCRDHNDTAAQSTCIKLNQLTKNERFLFYSATNLLLTYTTQAPNKLLLLAEMLIRRTMKDTTAAMKTEDLLLLYRLCQRQANAASALTLLLSPLSATYKSTDPHSYKRLLADHYFHNLGDYENSRQLYRELLLAYDIDWYYVCQYISATLLIKESSRNGEEKKQSEDERKDAHRTNGNDREQKTEESARPTVASMEERVKEMRNLFTQQLQTSDAGEASTTPTPHQTKRNVYLALMEVEYQLLHPPSPVSLPDVTNSPNSIADPDQFQFLYQALLGYYAAFGNKQCFFNDIKKYIDVLPHTFHSKLITDLLPKTGLSSFTCLAESTTAASAPADSSSPSSSSLHVSITTTDQLLNYINAHQLLHYLGKYIGKNKTEMERLATEYYILYLHSLTLSAPAPLSSERGVGDPLLILFAHTALSLFTLTGSNSYLFDCILLLEWALQAHSPHNYTLQLFLLRLYCHPSIGCIGRAAILYERLDAKQIQCELLTHLLLDDSFRYCHLIPTTNLLLSRYNQFYSSYEREEASSLQLAYSNGNWSAILEMREFADRMQASYQHEIVEEMRGWMAVLQGGKEIVEVYATLEKRKRERRGEGTVVVGAEGKDKDGTGGDEKRVGGVGVRTGEEREEEIEDENEGEGKRVMNNDYSVLPAYSPSSSFLSTQLNRPSPAFLSSSFLHHNESLIKSPPSPGPSSTGTNVSNSNSNAGRSSSFIVPNAFHQALSLHRLLSRLLECVCTGKIAGMRSRLIRLEDSLRFFQLLPPPLISAATAAPSPPISLLPIQQQVQLQQPFNTFDDFSFDHLHWQTVFLALELTACVVEVKPVTSKYFDQLHSLHSKAPSSAGLVTSNGTEGATANREAMDAQLIDHKLRWMSMHRQLTVLLTLVDSLCKRMSGVTILKAELTDVDRVVYGETQPIPHAPISASSVRDISCYLTFAMLVLVLCVQTWNAAVPNRKQLTKKKKGAAAAASSATENGEWHEWVERLETESIEAVVGSRPVLSDIVKTLKKSVNQVKQVSEMMSKAKVECEAGLPVFLDKADAEVGKVGGSGNWSVERANCLSRLRESIGTSVENWKQLISSYLAVLDSIKT